MLKNAIFGKPFLASLLAADSMLYPKPRFVGSTKAMLASGSDAAWMLSRAGLARTRTMIEAMEKLYAPPKSGDSFSKHATQDWLSR